MDVTDVYDENDVARIGKQEDKYLTDGPGKYHLRVKKLRKGKSTAFKTKNQPFMAAELEVVEAFPVTDSDGTEHQPTHQPGTVVKTAKVLKTPFDWKVFYDLTGAVLNLPPIIKVGEGDFAGQNLAVLEESDLDAVCEDEGTAVQDKELFCTVYPREVTKGPNKGKVYHNAYFKPSTEGEMAYWPTWDALKEKMSKKDLTALMKKRGMA